jgi:3-oxoadipate enol-lactonase
MAEIRFYDDKGAGTALVLLHAFPLHRKSWRLQVDGLSKELRVIAPDLRGFGEDKTPGPFSITDLADDVKQFADKLGLSKFVLCGLSMGGYIAQAFAAKYPQALLGLILMDTKADADTAEGKAGRDKLIATAKEKGITAVADAMLPKLVPENLVKTHHPVVAELRQMILANSAGACINALTAMRDRPDRNSDMANLKLPAIVIHGNQDAIIPLDVAEKLSKSLPYGSLHVVKGAGHIPSMEKPDDVNAAINAFVASLK